METHSKPSPDIPKWSALLVEAVNKPGMIMQAYSAFHNYCDRKSNSRSRAMPIALCGIRLFGAVGQEISWTSRDY